MTSRRDQERSLAVWLYGRHIATLTEPSRYRYGLAFTEEALDVFGEGARVLSLSLPVTTQAVRDSRDRSDHRVSAFLEGLLPEGNLRRQIAAAMDVPHIDKMALLAQVSAECAGAVQFLAPGDTPTAGTVRRLSPAEVTRLVADLPTYHLPPGATPQASLAALYDTAPVTHIDARFKGTGHVINGCTTIDRVDTEDLIAEATQWGLGRTTADRTIRAVMERTYQAICESPTAFDHAIRERLLAMWTRRSWPSGR